MHLQAFDLAIAGGKLPPRPWNSSVLAPEQAARLLLSHVLRTPDGPLLFAPSANDPFASGFVDGARFATAATSGSSSIIAAASSSQESRKAGRTASAVGGGVVDVGVRVVELGSRTVTIGSESVLDREVYVDDAR